MLPVGPEFDCGAHPDQVGVITAYGAATIGMHLGWPDLAPSALSASMVRAVCAHMLPDVENIVRGRREHVELT